MAEIDRPDRITNVTGLRAQSEHPGVAAASVRGVRWPRGACRLCERPVWLFASLCACGMTDPAREARRPYMAPALVVTLIVLAVVAFW